MKIIQIMKDEQETNKWSGSDIDEGHAWLADCESKELFGPLDSYEVIESEEPDLSISPEDQLAALARLRIAKADAGTSSLIKDILTFLGI